MGREGFRVTRMDQLPAGIAAFGPDFHHPVGFGNHVRVVLDDDHGVPLINECMHELNEATTVRLM